jgi:hypothetical protein
MYYMHLRGLLSKQTQPANQSQEDRAKALDELRDFLKKKPKKVPKALMLAIADYNPVITEFLYSEFGIHIPDDYSAYMNKAGKAETPYEYSLSLKESNDKTDIRYLAHTPIGLLTRNPELSSDVSKGSLMFLACADFNKSNDGKMTISSYGDLQLKYTHLDSIPNLGLIVTSEDSPCLETAFRICGQSIPIMVTNMLQDCYAPSLHRNEIKCIAETYGKEDSLIFEEGDLPDFTYDYNGYYKKIMKYTPFDNEEIRGLLDADNEGESEKTVLIIAHRNVLLARTKQKLRSCELF